MAENETTELEEDAPIIEEVVEETTEEEVVDEWIIEPVDETDYAFIKDWVIDSIWKKVWNKLDWDGDVVIFSTLDIYKVNQWQDVIIWENGEITYEKGERYTKLLSESVEREILQINEAFDEKIDSYLSKYPINERNTFAEKKREAEKVIAGEASIYIDAKAAKLWITSKALAEIFIQKNEEWTALYEELETEKDLKIAGLKASLK